VEDQALKWWHVRWRLAGRIVSRFAKVSGKIIGLLCLVALIISSAYYLLSPWITAQGLKSDPRFGLLPVSLSDKVEAPLSSAIVEGHGFEIKFPKDVAINTAEDTMIVQSRDGQIWIKNAPSDVNDLVFVAFLKNDRGAQELLEPWLLRSKFKLMQAVMSTTPDQVKWWRLRSRQNQRAEFLLLAKLTVLVGSVHRLTPIYAISSGEIRGFQLGNPNVPPYEAHLDLFDASDRHFSLDVMGPEGHGQVLTQEEINAIVASIQPISDH
jgi:hypothetical protein